MVVAGLEAEGLYGLLRGALSHSPMSLAPPPSKRHCQAPTATISKLLSQESGEVEPKPSAPAAEEGILAQKTPSLAISQALELAFPTHMMPLFLNVGTSKGFTNTRLEGAVRDHPPPGLSYVLMCTETIWG